MIWLLLKKNNQNTLKDKIEIDGIGLHNGIKVNLTIKPSAPGTGIVFKRIDIKENNLSPAERISVTKKYDDYWGVSWYMFSNPMYGDWEGSIIDFDYSISRDKKLEKKSKSLDQK